MADQTSNESRCRACGMPVGDPALHHERYAHLPVINREGTVLAFCYHRYAFVARCPDAGCEANKALADFV